MRVFWTIFLCLISFNSLSKNPINKNNLPSQIKINNIIINKPEIKNHYNFLLKTQKYWGKNFEVITTKTVIDDIIEHEILKKHADKIKINLTDEEVNYFLNIFAEKYFKNYRNFQNFVQKNQLNIESFKKRIWQDLLWQKIINEIIKPRINVSNFEINEWVEKEKITQKKHRYLLQDYVLENANIINEIQGLKSKFNNKKYTKFLEKYFNFFADKKPENLNWFWNFELSETILQEIKDLKIDEYSKPILINQIWHIYQLIDKKHEYFFNEKEKTFIINKISLEKLNLYVKSYYQEIYYNNFIEIR
ncbi:MAG: SurA N-terminal domain-containing protein [Rickettsiales bacterium]